MRSVMIAFEGPLPFSRNTIQPKQFKSVLHFYLRTTMAKNTQLSKDKLVETAAALIYRQGWNATGINQILTEAAVPKGSFYYYFESKEDLGVAIVRHHGRRQAQAFAQTLANVAFN